MNRRMVPSPASPLIADSGALIGENSSLFVGVRKRLLSI